MTKIVTVTCLMQLVEKGLIKLDDDMRPLVPELAKMQILRGFDDGDKPILEDNVKPITLRYVFPALTVVLPLKSHPSVILRPVMLLSTSKPAANQITSATFSRIPSDLATIAPTPI